MSEDKQEKDPIEEAYGLIEQDRQRRAEECMARIQTACRELRCTLDINLEKNGAAFIPKLGVVAL